MHIDIYMVPLKDNVALTRLTHIQIATCILGTLYSMHPLVLFQWLNTETLDRQ